VELWFLAIIEKETHPIIKANMISHLKNTYMDTILYGFRRAKCVHGKILTGIEDGRLTWLDSERIADTRKTHIQCPLTLEDYREQQREDASVMTLMRVSHRDRNNMSTRMDIQERVGLPEGKN
jgi:hypothetical protein